MGAGGTAAGAMRRHTKYSTAADTASFEPVSSPQLTPSMADAEREGSFWKYTEKNPSPHALLFIMINTNPWKRAARKYEMDRNFILKASRGQHVDKARVTNATAPKTAAQIVKALAELNFVSNVGVT